MFWYVLSAEELLAGWGELRKGAKVSYVASVRFSLSSGG